MSLIIILTGRLMLAWSVVMREVLCVLYGSFFELVFSVCVMLYIYINKGMLVFVVF